MLVPTFLFAEGQDLLNVIDNIISLFKSFVVGILIYVLSRLYFKKRTNLWPKLKVGLIFIALVICFILFILFRHDSTPGSGLF
jgi:hypothetical protein